MVFKCKMCDASLNINIGDMVEWQGQKANIVGIINTDYMEYQLDRKLNYGINDDFFHFNCEYKGIF